jgi:hypothetical protein
MEGIAVTFGYSDAAAGVAFTAVVIPKRLHILSSVLMFSEWLDPLLSQLGL